MTQNSFQSYFLHKINLLEVLLWSEDTVPSELHKASFCWCQKYLQEFQVTILADEYYTQNLTPEWSLNIVMAWYQYSWLTALEHVSVQSFLSKGHQIQSQIHWDSFSSSSSLLWHGHRGPLVSLSLPDLRKEQGPISLQSKIFFSNLQSSIQSTSNHHSIWELCISSRLLGVPIFSLF